MIFGERDRGRRWFESQIHHLPIEDGQSTSDYFERLCEYYSNPSQRKVLEGCRSVVEISMALKILENRLDSSTLAIGWANERIQRESNPPTHFVESSYLIHRGYYNEIIGRVNVAQYESMLTKSEAMAAYRGRIRNELTGLDGNSGCNLVQLFWRSVSKTVFGSLHPAAKDHFLSLAEREVIQTVGYPEEVMAAMKAATAYDRLSRLIDTPVTLAQYNYYIHGPVKTGLAYKDISPTVMNELELAMMRDLGIEQ